MGQACAGSGPHFLRDGAYPGHRRFNVVPLVMGVNMSKAIAVFLFGIAPILVWIWFAIREIARWG